MKNKTNKNKIANIVLTCLLPLLGFISCAPTQSAKVAAYSPDQMLASSVFDRVNDYRKSKGSGPLKRHAGLDKLAVQHSEYMCKKRGTFEIYGKNVTHLGSEGRALVAMRIYSFINTGENVAAAMKGASDSHSTAELVALWKNSPKHEAAMRAPEYTHTGVGVVTDTDGTVFATQLFATRTISQMAARERFNSF